MAINLLPDTGEYHVFNSSGDRIFDTRGDVVYIWGSVDIQENVDIGGDVDINGTVDIGGTVEIHGDPSLLIDGSTTMNGDLTINADLTTTGDTILGGNLKLDGDLDADGHTISGATLKTQGEGVTITGDVVTFDDGSYISYGGGHMTVEAAGYLHIPTDVDGINVLECSHLSVVGTGGDGSINAAGPVTASGYYVSGGTPTVSGSRGANAALASLLIALADIGLIVNSTTV